MSDVFNVRDALQLRVLEEVVVGERAIDADVDVLRDRGRDHHPAEPPVVGGQVGPTASEGYPQRSSGDEHLGDPHTKPPQRESPAAVASRWNISTVSRENSSSSLPMSGSFLIRSGVTVITWQPIE